MYAIVDIAGKQMKVEKDQKIFVHHLEGDAGSTVHFDKVLLIDNDNKVIIGNPVVSDALITGKILSHLKGDKIMVFKKKKRKGYKVLKGHRQLLTEVQIEEIIEKGGIKIMSDLKTKKTKKELTKPGKITKGKKTDIPVTQEAYPAPVTEPEIITAPAVPGKDKKVKPGKKPVSKPKKAPAKTAEKGKSSSGKKVSESKVKKTGTGTPGKKPSSSAAKSKISKAKDSKKTSSTKKQGKSKK